MTPHIINIPSDDSRIYKQLLAFLNFLIGATDQERDVLAELIKLNHEYSGLPEDKRAKFILSTDMRKETREKLDIEEKQFNGLISRLKGKNYMGEPLLDADGIINKKLLFEITDEGLSISINMIKSRQPLQRDEPKEEEVVSSPVESTVDKLKPAQEKANQETVSAGDAYRKLAPPTNGKETIVGDKFSDDDITILQA